MSICARVCVNVVLRTQIIFFFDFTFLLDCQEAKKKHDSSYHKVQRSVFFLYGNVTLFFIFLLVKRSAAKRRASRTTKRNRRTVVYFKVTLKKMC